MTHQKRYLSYLLRLWQESDGNPPLWRAYLEGAQSGERRGFASMAELFDFLESETAQGQPESSTSEKGGHAEEKHNRKAS